METVYYHASGGIIIDDGQVLLLRKRVQREIVLPKGHIEPGETAEQTALRETTEETGYASLRLLADLGTEQARYVLKGKQYNRDETYFLMALDDHRRQAVEGYDDAEHDRATFELLWTPLDEAAGLVTFEPARTFVRRAVELHRQEESRRTS
jgi:8-oxo-dGTP pyrophosphatase MutT (NUDIX family)